MDPIDKLLDALEFFTDTGATQISVGALATDDTDETMGDLVAAALRHRAAQRDRISPPGYWIEVAREGEGLACDDRDEHVRAVAAPLVVLPDGSAIDPKLVASILALDAGEPARQLRNEKPRVEVCDRDGVARVTMALASIEEARTFASESAARIIVARQSPQPKPDPFAIEAVFRAYKEDDITIGRARECAAVWAAGGRFELPAPSN